jgi:hypothetical protein
MNAQYNVPVEFFQRLARIIEFFDPKDSGEGAMLFI